MFSFYKNKCIPAKKYDLYNIRICNIYQNMESNIDYRVKDANNYVGKKGLNNKQISKIVEKKGEFQFINEEDQFDIEVIFKNHGIITKIQLEVKNVNIISIDMFQENVKIQSFQKSLSSQRIKIFTKLDFQLQEKAQIFDKAQIRFVNFPEPKSTCIKFILFKGFKEVESKRKSVPTNFSQKDTFQMHSKKKTAEEKQEQKKIFQGRQKTKGKTPVHELLNQLPRNVHRKNREQDQQQQIKKAIQLSKKQHQKQKQNQKQYKNTNQNFVDSGKVQQIGFFEYDVVEWEKVKKIYEHVSPAWVQAQRNIEKQRNIQLRHSIAEKIKQKVFQKLTFCINNIKYDQKTKLSNTIKQLGGKIIEQPQNNCYIVTNNMEGGKINLSKSLSHIIYIRPEFVLNCSQLGTLLDYHDYKP